MGRYSPAELVEGVLRGEERATARLLRLVDDDPLGARPALAALYPHAGRARLIGITGNPGAGKSTLVGALIGHYRAAGQRVGVIAVDPSSPFSGGAILGDRVRMMAHSADPGVFIRSAASRGALGGISRSTDDMVTVLDAFGCQVIIVETVGVGQAEVDIAQLAQTTLVVLTPGYGDEVQSLKAGLLEIADVYVVNKADMAGTDALVRQLRSLWELVPAERRTAWRPPVLKTIARDGTGVPELAEAIAGHGEFREGHPEGHRSERERLQRLLFRLVQDDLARELMRGPLAAEPLADLVEALAERRQDPYSAAEAVVSGLLGKPGMTK